MSVDSFTLTYKGTEWLWIHSQEEQEDNKMEDEMRKADEDGDMQGSGERYRIDLERFGIFVSRLRSEKGMTQKALADKLYVSNKAVSKWENGLSLPDISLLEPLAETLGVTVPELLHGERQADGKLAEVQLEGLYTVEGLRKWFTECDAAIRMSNEEKKLSRKKGIRLYMAAILVSGAEVLALYLWGGRLGMGVFDISMEVLFLVGMVLMFGPWFFWVLPERLPAYYDVMSLSYFVYGGMHMNIPGVHFNNRNWPHMLKAWRKFGFWIPVGWPVCWLLCWLLFQYQPMLKVGEVNVPMMVFRIFILIAVILGGLFVPPYVVARKYK